MWSGVMDSWFERMNKYISAEEGFIEKLDKSTCRSLFYESFGYELTEPPSYYLFSAKDFEISMDVPYCRSVRYYYY